MLIKSVVRVPGEQELVSFSLEAADHGQARRFIQEKMPHVYVVALKKIAWKLSQHFDFPVVSHVTHIAQHNKARKRRGCDTLVMDI